jgi:hypothetical protein
MKKYTPSPERKKEITKFKTAGSRWYLMTHAKGDPAPGASGMTFSPLAKKQVAKSADLVQYAAALGRKQGKLPIDLTDWSGTATWNGDTGSVLFSRNRSLEKIRIPLRFLEWTPAAPVDETEYPEMKLAA